MPFSMFDHIKIVLCQMPFLLLFVWCGDDAPDWESFRGSPFSFVTNIWRKLGSPLARVPATEVGENRHLRIQ